MHPHAAMFFRSFPFPPSLFFIIILFLFLFLVPPSLALALSVVEQKKGKSAGKKKKLIDLPFSILFFAASPKIDKQTSYILEASSYCVGCRLLI